MEISNLQDADLKGTKFICLYVLFAILRDLALEI